MTTYLHAHLNIYFMLFRFFEYLRKNENLAFGVRLSILDFISNMWMYVYIFFSYVCICVSIWGENSEQKLVYALSG